MSNKIEVKDLVIGLHKLNSHLFQEAERVVRESSQLTLTQMLILQASEGDCQGQDEVAQVLRISQPAVSKQLLKLIQLNIIEPVVTSRRSWKVKLTAVGQSELTKAFKAYDDYCKLYFNKLDQTQKKQLNQILNILNIS
ncbi:MAG: hypothetical protein OHK0017_11540 [Patescibacteria group bacterium]